MSFKFQKTKLDGVIYIEADSYDDDRGWFYESFKESVFKENGIDVNFVQDNQSFSYRNVLRGIHFQKDPKAQGKLVRCLRGVIYDVAVDLRPESPTYKQWVGYHLAGNGSQMLWIPEGFGHGFSAITDNVQIAYKCTNEYDPKCDAGIRFDDPELNIDWQINLSEAIVSDKDLKLPFLKDFIG